MNDAVLCVGELLWDALPAGLFLGGAPHNVAYHLHQRGCPAALASRIGDDVLGREALLRLAAAGLDASLVQRDPALPTGFVGVKVDAEGLPRYDIVEPAAWDALALTAELLGAARSARAVVFGSLAQRHPSSRTTIQALVEASPLAVFDVNLRPPFLDREVVRTSLHAADCVKLNDEELGTLSAWFDRSGPMSEATAALADGFGCRLVCVTRGADGAALWHEGRWTEHPGYRVEVRDTVGAGDAFLAGLLDAILAGTDDADALDHACRAGAYVAARPGAAPAYDADAPPRLGG